jgi:hypothetical protein
MYTNIPLNVTLSSVTKLKCLFSSLESIFLESFVHICYHFRYRFSKYNFFPTTTVHVRLCVQYTVKRYASAVSKILYMCFFCVQYTVHVSLLCSVYCTCISAVFNILCRCSAVFNIQ